VVIGTEQAHDGPSALIRATTDLRNLVDPVRPAHVVTPGGREVDRSRDEHADRVALLDCGGTVHPIGTPAP
jgi:hypothetical protein